jgi:hypothetical protein
MYIAAWMMMVTMQAQMQMLLMQMDMRLRKTRPDHRRRVHDQ